MNAQKLVEPSMAIYHGLWAVGIKPVSNSTDGAQVERSTQCLMMGWAKDCKTYTFKHPLEQRDPIKVKLQLFDGLPLIQQQDTKHLRKTCRNNIFSGARSLVIGNYYAAYHQIYEIAFSEKSAKGTAPPIKRRDVVKLDRQDDNAAARLFSAAVLEWEAERANPRHGLIHLLFVLGELVDSCQSHTVTHEERIQMAWRVLFFIEHWKEFLMSAGYSLGQYYISHQCASIIKTVVNAVLSLILTYRDYGEGQPLLPWLHSTEPVEHMFGEAWQLCPNFTHLEFIYLANKLYRVMSSLNMDAKPSNDKASAAGYSHGAYLRQHDIDLQILSRFPSDKVIETHTKAAYGKAHGLMIHLRYMPKGRSADSSGLLTLPPIKEWYPDGVETCDDSESDDGTDRGEDDAESEDEEALHRSIFKTNQMLERAIDNVKRLPLTPAIERAIFAATAIDIDRMDEM